MQNVIVIDHPVVQTKLTELRDFAADHRKFRALLDEIASLMVYEVTRDWPTTPEVEDLEEAESHFVPPDPPLVLGRDPLLKRLEQSGVFRRLDRRDVRELTLESIRRHVVLVDSAVNAIVNASRACAPVPSTTRASRPMYGCTAACSLTPSSERRWTT